MIVTMCDTDECYNYENIMTVTESFKINVNHDVDDICSDCANYYIKKYEGKVFKRGLVLDFKEVV